MTRLRAFSYKAMQRDGRTCKGVVSAIGEADAFARLRAENLSPLSLKPAGIATPSGPKNQALSDTGLEDIFSNLAVLLRAGADIRSALSVMDAEQPHLRQAAQAILGGASVDTGLGSLMPPRHGHLRALIAAGEARGTWRRGWIRRHACWPPAARFVSNCSTP